MENWRELISQPKYKVKVKRDVYIEMRDGVHLAADIFRPDAEGKFPALLAMCPYSKDRQDVPIPPQPIPQPFWDGSLEAGNSYYLVPRGYVHVIVDVRGTGKSEGEWLNFYSEEEIRDGYELVEWIASQDWCDGNVGMVGISYFGSIQYLVAAMQPPHLKACFPYDAFGDVYREVVWHGGMINFGFFEPTGAVTFCNTTNVPATMRESSPEEVERLVRAARANPDFQINPQVVKILTNPQKNPSLFDFLVHPLDGPFYRERSGYTRYDKIKVPVYLGAPWGQYWLHTPGAFSSYLGIDAPKKLIITPPPDLERPWYEFHDVVVRWYDHWLKGIDTGIMDEPPIKLWIMGANQWRYENEWPLARTKWTKFYLHTWERLLPEPGIYPVDPPHYNQPDAFLHKVFHSSTEIQSVKYLSPPMNEDMEITGPITLNLYASIDADDTNWIVWLKDVAPHGPETVLTQGWLKASHRAIDESKSKPYQPYHPHTSPVPVVPGEVCEYAIGISPTSNVFKVGHRIKLEIASCDYMTSRFYHIPSSKITVHKIYHDKEHPSHLVMPLIPKA